MKPEDLCAFMDIISYSFQNPLLLETALTHSTFAYENRNYIEDNERIEFLGDAVLQLVISEQLYLLAEKLKEGKMTKTRALVVCEQTLAQAAKDISLDKYLRLGKGELQTGGAEKPSSLSNSLEAVFGAIYLDGGLDAAKRVILSLLSPYLELALHGKIQYDFKSRLLELVQMTKGQSTLSFAIVNEEGPVHNMKFTAAAILDDVEIAYGVGSSKKEAEQMAAEMALLSMPSAVTDDGGEE
ncbi:MAG TPA: ribonuclease III [Clostridiaceae bacterium]|nr:ribonuclease III [Clostridiaceae bacterium]